MNHCCICFIFILVGTVSMSPVMSKSSCQQKREIAFSEISQSLLRLSDALKRRQVYELQQIPAIYKQKSCIKSEMEFKLPNLMQIAKEYQVISLLKIFFEILDDYNQTTESQSAYKLLQKQQAFNTLQVKQNYYQAYLRCSIEDVADTYLKYSGNVVTLLPKTCRISGQRPPTDVANKLKHVQNVNRMIKLLDTTIQAIGEAKKNMNDGKQMLGQLAAALGELPRCFNLMSLLPNKPNKCDGVSKKFKMEKLTVLITEYLKRNEFGSINDFTLEYGKWFQSRIEPALIKLRKLSGLKKIIRLRRTTKSDANDRILRDMLMCYDRPLARIQDLVENKRIPVSHSLSNILSTCSVPNDWRDEVLNQVNLLSDISHTIGQFFGAKISSLQK